MTVDYNPTIGKNVIETLTLGMYEDSRFIYREYIQNAADQIDIAVEEGLINHRDEANIIISIDKLRRRICIEDNATGIKTNLFLRFLGDVAKSEKDASNRKGFRGIGRLGGLGYCEKLIFETSYKGEAIKSIMTLDAKLLKKIISDRKDETDASGVISIITTIEKSPESIHAHYFKVCLEEVTNDLILNINKVNEYISLVAPLPFRSDFTFKSEIKKYLKQSNIMLDEYNIYLNNDKIFKAYKNVIIDKDEKTTFLGVDFLKVMDESGILLAIGWYGISDHVNEVLTNQVIERGIRLRKNNIQIGSEGTLNRFFKSERTNFRFIGELYAVSQSFIPNARRDYFNENKTSKVFEETLTHIFKEENLENRYAQNVSKIHNRARDIEKYKLDLEEYERVKTHIDSSAKQKHYLDRLKISKEKALHASKEIEKVKRLSEHDENIKKLYDHIIGDKDLSFDPDIEKILKRTIYSQPTFNKLSENETKVAREIIDLIYETVEFKIAEILKKKIVDKYN